MTYDHIPRAGELNVSRIQPGDNSTETFYKLTGGNPGALAALVALLICEAVDPDAGPLGQALPIEQMDTLGIYEKFAYLFYNDVCERNPARVRALLRAVDLGILSRDELAGVIEGCQFPDGPKLNIPRIVGLVRQLLPRFDPLNQCKV